MWSGVLTSTSSRQRSTISGSQLPEQTDFGPAVFIVSGVGGTSYPLVQTLQDVSFSHNVQCHRHTDRRQYDASSQSYCDCTYLFTISTIMGHGLDLERSRMWPRYIWFICGLWKKCVGNTKLDASTLKLLGKFLQTLEINVVFRLNHKPSFTRVNSSLSSFYLHKIWQNMTNTNKHTSWSNSTASDSRSKWSWVWFPAGSLSCNNSRQVVHTHVLCHQAV